MIESLKSIKFKVFLLIKKNQALKNLVLGEGTLSSSVKSNSKSITSSSVSLKFFEFFEFLLNFNLTNSLLFLSLIYNFFKIFASL